MDIFRKSSANHKFMALWPLQTDKDQKVCENVWDDFFENFDKFRLEGIFEKYQVHSQIKCCELCLK